MVRANCISVECGKLTASCCTAAVKSTKATTRDKCGNRLHFSVIVLAKSEQVALVIRRDLLAQRLELAVSLHLRVGSVVIYPARYSPTDCSSGAPSARARRFGAWKAQRGVGNSARIELKIGKLLFEIYTWPVHRLRRQCLRHIHVRPRDFVDSDLPPGLISMSVAALLMKGRSAEVLLHRPVNMMLLG